jgi:hypothetical protein
MRRAPIATLLAAAVVASLVACTPRNTLGTGSTACIKAIPVAADEVHHKGKPEGVREVTAASLAQRFPEFAPLGKEKLCLVAFSDDFKPGDVAHAKQQLAGRYALVVVDSHQKVVESFVLPRLPLRFRHPV